MARIRTIKPQFWEDTKIGKLSIGARLLFIGCWNMADDEGLLVWDAKFLKGGLFRYDDGVNNKSIKKWMAEITSVNLIAVFTDVHGETWGFICNMRKHQNINRPQKSQHPDIIEAILKQYSLNTQGVINDGSVLEGCKEGCKEGNKEEEGKGVQGETPKTATENIVKNIFNSYQNNIGQLTPITTEKLKDAEDEYSEQWVLDAISEAVKYEKRNLAYILKILETWKHEGRGNKNGAGKQNTQSNKHGYGVIPRDKYTESPEYPDLQ